MKDSIKNIISGINIEKYFQYLLDSLYSNGPISVSDMELLSYLQLYHSEKFKNYKDSILNSMGVFYKETTENSLKDVIFRQYKDYIKETFNQTYTPVQADIVKSIESHNCFSFSAPTSTGKSFVFMNQIIASKNDVVVVVPGKNAHTDHLKTV